MNLIISRLSKRHWLPAYLKPINTHPTLGEGQNGKLYGSGPDPFPPPRNKRERVGYARIGKASLCYSSASVPKELIATEKSLGSKWQAALNDQIF